MSFLMTKMYYVNNMCVCGIFYVLIVNYFAGKQTASAITSIKLPRASHVQPFCWLCNKGNKCLLWYLNKVLDHVDRMITSNPPCNCSSTFEYKSLQSRSSLVLSSNIMAFYEGTHLSPVVLLTNGQQCGVWCFLWCYHDDIEKFSVLPALWRRTTNPLPKVQWCGTLIFSLFRKVNQKKLLNKCSGCWWIWDIMTLI